MKNLEKLLHHVEDISHRIERTKELITTLRRQKQDLQADFCEIDLHYAREDRDLLLGRIEVIERRRDEIMEFERDTGLVFDVAAMELPPGNLLAWWKDAIDSDPEIARLWAGQVP